jgi:hypothetical protein
MTLPTRKFGVEIEFIGISMDTAALALCNAGVACRVERYGHAVPRNWKIVEDGSVIDRTATSFRGLGGELVSPPLTGEEGLEEVRKALRAMVAAGATVNKTCGLHVHVDAADLTGADVARIFVNYRSHESVINQFMPRSRVDNGYARPVSAMYDFPGFLTRVQNPSAMHAVAASFERYSTVNFASYARHGTVEFRQHSGSVNASKVTNWIQFVLHFVANAKAANSVVAAPVATRSAMPIAPIAPRRHRGRQTNYAARRALWTLLAQANTRSAYPTNGCVTVGELAAVSGYTVSTVSVLLSGLRNRNQTGGSIIGLRTRTGSYMRSERASTRRVINISVYRQDALDAWLGNGAPSVVAPVAARACVTTANVFEGTVDTLFAGMPDEIRGFYNERASDFGFEWR